MPSGERSVAERPVRCASADRSAPVTGSGRFGWASGPILAIARRARGAPTTRYRDRQLGPFVEEQRRTKIAALRSLMRMTQITMRVSRAVPIFLRET